MSDVPPPPPPGGAVPPAPPPPPPAAPPPPPPPSNLIPPAYTGFNTERPASIGRLTNASVILVLLSAAASLGAAALGEAVIDDAQAYLDGEIDNDALLEAVAPATLLQFVYAALALAAWIVTMIWMRKMANNHQQLHRVGTWGAGWAIGAWFLPPFVLFIIPFLMFRELWKASNPDIPPGGDWRTGPVSPTITAWWVLFGLAPLVLAISQGSSALEGFSADEEALARQFAENRASTWIGAAITVGAAIVYALMTRELSERHRRLTGESNS